MIFTYALDSAAISIDYIDCKNSYAFTRQGLHLPQVCRQVHCETKHPLERFFYVSINGDACICAWESALNRQRCHLHAVVELKIMEDMKALVPCWIAEQAGDGIPPAARHVLPYLEHVLVESQHGQDNHELETVRDIFGRPGL